MQCASMCLILSLCSVEVWQWTEFVWCPLRSHYDIWWRFNALSSFIFTPSPPLTQYQTQALESLHYVWPASDPIRLLLKWVKFWSDTQHKSDLRYLIWDIWSEICSWSLPNQFPNQVDTQSWVKSTDHRTQPLPNLRYLLSNFNPYLF